jgi:MFS family permease
MPNITYKWQPAYDDGEVLDHTLSATYRVPNPNTVSAMRAVLGSGVGAALGAGAGRLAEIAAKRRLRYAGVPAALGGAALGALASAADPSPIKVEVGSVTSATGDAEEAMDAILYLRGHVAPATFERKWGYLPSPVE